MPQPRMLGEYLAICAKMLNKESGVARLYFTSMMWLLRVCSVSSMIRFVMMAFVVNSISAYFSSSSSIRLWVKKY